MRARRFTYSFVIASVLALAVPAIAQKSPAPPKNATAQCADGTYSTAKTERGACSKHGGVKTWFGTGGSAAASAETKPAATAAKKSTSEPASKSATASPKTATSATSKSTGAAATKNTASAAPKDATGECTDGTYTRAKTERGACSGHGGVKTWFSGSGSTGASALPAVATKPAPPAAPSGSAPNTAPAPAPAPKQSSGKAPTVSPAGAPQGATAKCKDGTYSSSKTHTGACSHHGGVAEWFK